MHIMRLLSFLNDIERTLLADDPEPDGGIWKNSRMVNLENGLARLTLASGLGDGSPQPRGFIFVQAFTLADGSFSLKANLHWHNTEATTTKAIFSRPGINWRLAAAEIAALWMAGAPVTAESTQSAEADEPLAATA